MGRIARLAEAHTLKLWQIEQLAKQEMDEVYEGLQARARTLRFATMFDVLKAEAGRIIGKRGQEAIEQGYRYSKRLMGGDVPRPKIADMADTVESFLTEIEEHSRHVEALVAIRSGRMAQKWINAKAISRVFLDDFRYGGEHTSMLKNALKRSVGSAVIQLGKEAEFAAMRKAE